MGVCFCVVAICFILRYYSAKHYRVDLCHSAIQYQSPITKPHCRTILPYHQVPYLRYLRNRWQTKKPVTIYYLIIHPITHHIYTKWLYPITHHIYTKWLYPIITPYLHQVVAPYHTPYLHHITHLLTLLWNRSLTQIYIILSFYLPNTTHSLAHRFRDWYFLLS